MHLHENKKDFDDLANIVSNNLHITEQAVKRDYFIVYLLDKLAHSEFGNQCVFKGGTSLSKCYPGSIERFSEDIDLTYLGIKQPDNVCEKEIKKIIAVMTVGATVQKIPGEGNARNKSRNVWFDLEANKIKLEIGCSVQPEPYSLKTLKSYIHEYLEDINNLESIEQFGLRTVTINTLNVERTFLDKILAVKRHAICGTLKHKTRHIYDVVRLYRLPEIQSFLANEQELKRILTLTKDTDSHYLGKRNLSQDYNPRGAYDFEIWKDKFDGEIKSIYENLHKELLYTNIQQDFSLAIKCFDEINEVFIKIGE
ncbi:MAG: nucleotidyl transferase AbiEii/AbiGii toxin family protein [Clostridiales bacterium]|nr:nucleotidyl transferase AbiEii/AbiGii toxin family protein [Clostridiales bacterium]